jgi:mono/diheme cytochrome c family protein
MTQSRILLALIPVTVLTACGPATVKTQPMDSAQPAGGMGSGMGMGPGSGMMARHHAAVPEPYAGLTNPVAADEESLARGEEIYTASCATCHGDGGMGGGPAGASLDPAPVAHTSQMLGDDYLFWRTSEGGAPFDTTMPAWKDSLDEQALWDVINYMRALGRGEVAPRHTVGGAAYDPAVEQAERAEMLAQAVEQSVLTQEEANLFDQVHIAMDELVAARTVEAGGGMGQMKGTLLAELVETGEITQEQAGAFDDVHDRLVGSGLMQ